MGECIIEATRRETYCSRPIETYRSSMWVLVQSVTPEIARETFQYRVFHAVRAHCAGTREHSEPLLRIVEIKASSWHAARVQKDRKTAIGSRVAPFQSW